MPVTVSRKELEAKKQEINADSALAKLFRQSDQKEVDAFFRLGAVERLSQEEQDARRHEAIGTRPVRTIKNEKEMEVDGAMESHVMVVQDG